MKMEQLKVLIENVQADPRRVRLLGILGQQLELLINSGQPDIAQLFTSLKEEALVSEAEYRELKATFPSEAVRLLI
jgi:hypothetical protein